MKGRHLTYAFIPAFLFAVLTAIFRSDVLNFIFEVFLVIGVFGLPFVARDLNDKLLERQRKNS